MTKVVIKDCNTYDIDAVTDKINSGIAALGGWNNFVKPGQSVLLKVNLIGPKPPESAAVTHCEFVRALVRILKNIGCAVWVGDSAGGAIAGIAPTAQSLEVSGLKRVAEEEGAELKNFDKEGAVEYKIHDGFTEKMYLAKPLKDADVVINLPKFKTHTSGIYTGAVKNVFGFVPGLKKAEYHKLAPDPMDFGNILVDIHRARKIDLHIMDGIVAMQGEGPTAGEPFKASKILFSTDPLALDTVAAKMIGLDISQIPILNGAVNRGLGNSDKNTIEISGDYEFIPELPDFRLPKRFASKKKQNYGALVKVIDFLKTRPKINRKVCKNCNMCVESCPVGAIDKNSKVINYGKCIECMCCHELCRYEAVQLKRENAVAAVMTKLYRGSYR